MSLKLLHFEPSSKARLTVLNKAKRESGERENDILRQPATHSILCAVNIRLPILLENKAKGKTKKGISWEKYYFIDSKSAFKDQQTFMFHRLKMIRNNKQS